ncbi:cytochrome P450 [Hypoxylon sp. EC38]|nr:cytochrome P450 [Hypoxylon sp. EC38]
MFSFSLHLASVAYVGIGFFVSYVRSHFYTVPQDQHLPANIHIVEITIVLSYRLLHHPLSRYPGPFLAKLTDGYAGFYAARRRLDLVTREDHQKYGSVMRHGPNKLIFNSVTALRDIYLSGRVIKADQCPVSQVAPNVFDLFYATNANLFRTKRRALGEALSRISIFMVEPIVLEHADIFIKQLMILFRPPMSLTPLDVTAVNIMERSKRLSFDILWDLFPRCTPPLNLQTDQRNRVIINNIVLGNYRQSYKKQFPFIHQAHLYKAIGRSICPVWAGFTGLLKAMYATCFGQPRDAQPKFYSEIADYMANGLEEDGAKLASFWTRFLFFLISAGDTTAAAISSAFIHLARNPECYRKLAEEIRGTFKNSSELRSGETLSSCPYLLAVIKETLRMSPPVSGTLWRQLDPEQEDDPLIVDGHSVPKGVLVGVNIYSLNHNKKYFPDPFKFSPERWLPADTNTLECLAAHQIIEDAFCPFSIGPRSCAAQGLVYLQIQLVLAKVLWHFDFKESLGKPGNGSESGKERPEDSQLYNTFTSLHDGPYLKFRPRHDLEESRKCYRGCCCRERPDSLDSGE